MKVIDIPGLGFRSDFELDSTLIQQRLYATELNVDDAIHILARESIEQHNVVESIDELGAQLGPYDLHHLIASGTAWKAFGESCQVLGAEVAC